ncbi:MAG: thiol reductant ABC exporter subunit CydC [Solirubrobacteraceae bacterium]|nr:thiol reductant ABC exporter subunit CydC [Solirubrobacteraceae bacterium]
MIVAPIRRALALATPAERRRLRLATVLGVVAGLAGAALLALSGYLIARAAEAPPVLSLTIAIVGVRGFGVLRAIARYGERLVSHDATLAILARLRADAFAAVAARPGAAGTAEADRIVGDVDRVQDAYLRSIAPLAVAAVVGIAALVAAALVLPVAAAVLAGTLLAGAVALPVQAARWTRRSTLRRAPSRALLVRELAATLDAAAELQVAGLAPRQIERIHDAGAVIDAIDRREGHATAIVGAAATAVGGLGAAAVLAVALPITVGGRLDPALLALLPLLVLGVGEAIAPLPAAARELHGTSDAVDRVTELLRDGGATRSTAERHRDVATTDATVALRDVTVRRGGRTVLDRVDLDVADGERVALVGPSGAGKSTVGELLVAFLPTADVTGDATIGGAPLAGMSPASLRSTVLHVPQDPYLFDADLAANLRLARPDADDATLVAALRRVGAGPWLDGLRDGLATPLGERGARLSGGERQRVGMARALLARGHRLLVLDEPVSHLPPADGVAVIRTVLDADPDRGALIVAHRPAEAALADRTVTLGADGRVRLPARA